MQPTVDGTTSHFSLRTLQLFASMVSASSMAVRTDTMSSTFFARARKINSFLVGLIDSSL